MNQIPDISRMAPAVMPFYSFTNLHNYQILLTANRQRLSEIGGVNVYANIPCQLVMLMSATYNDPLDIIYLGGQELSLSGVTPAGLATANGLELNPGQGYVFSPDESDITELQNAMGIPGAQKKIQAIRLSDIWVICPMATANPVLKVAFLQLNV
jgi:hypothetical protein